MRTSLSGRLAAGITTIGLLAVGLGATSMPAIAEEKPVDVYIGDSIVANNPAVKVDSTNRWSRLVSDADGATDLNVAVGGTGFLVYQGKTYSDQVDIALSRLKKSGTDVSQVRRVILVGGGNDFQKGIDATVIAKEAKAMLKGEYGQLPGQVNPEVRAKAGIAPEDVVTCRPADLLEPELEKYRQEFRGLAKSDEDVLSLALFPQVAPKFIEKRDHQPEPVTADAPAVRELYVDAKSIL